MPKNRAMIIVEQKQTSQDQGLSTSFLQNLLNENDEKTPLTAIIPNSDHHNVCSELYMNCFSNPGITNPFLNNPTTAKTFAISLALHKEHSVTKGLDQENIGEGRVGKHGLLPFFCLRDLFNGIRVFPKKNKTKTTEDASD